MPGLFALAGGDEFRPAYRKPDQALLALLPPDLGPIVIVPTAAAHEGPEQAIGNGSHHFFNLAPDIPITGALVVDTAKANDKRLGQRIAGAGLVYLTGGNPWYLVETLRGSAALEALQTVLQRGGIVAGSSAGAMALCQWMRKRGGGWQEGLALIPGIAVLPHHGDQPGALEATRADLPAEVAALGIPTGVTCVSLPEDDNSNERSQWRVLGARPVTIYRSTAVQQAREGETFSL